MARPNDAERAEHGRDVLVAEVVHAMHAAHGAERRPGRSRSTTWPPSWRWTSPPPPTAISPSPLPRRRRVALTSAGLDFLYAAPIWQDAVFARLTDDWSPTERADFHRAMTRLLAHSPELDDGTQAAHRDGFLPCHNTPAQYQGRLMRRILHESAGRD